MAYKTNKSPLNQFNALTGAMSSAVGNKNQQQNGLSLGLIGSMNTAPLNEQNTVVSRFVSQAKALEKQAISKPKKEVNPHLDKYKTDLANYNKDLEVKNARNNPYDLTSNFVEPYKPMANGQRNPWDKILKPSTKQMNPKATGNNNTVTGVFGSQQVPGSYNRSMSPVKQIQEMDPSLQPAASSEPMMPPSTVQQAVTPTYDLANN